jgi:hypothetical protein
VPYSESRANALFEKSAAKGHRTAQAELLLRPERSESAQHRGFALLQHFATTTGDADLLVLKGIMLDDGRGTQEDEKAAVRCFEQAAHQCHAVAVASLAGSYELGCGVEQNLPKARELYEKAADAQHAGSQRDLANMLYAGEGGPADKERARRMFQLAAERCVPRAQHKFGWMCWRGEGGPQSNERAIEWLTRCVENENKLDTKAFFAPKAMWYLYRIYSGFDSSCKRNEPIDAAKGREWLQRAAEAGNEDAQYILGSYSDEAAGRALLQRAAPGGHISAQSVLESFDTFATAVSASAVRIVKTFLSVLQLRRA